MELLNTRLWDEKNSKSRNTNEAYILKNELGSGTQGTVYKIEDCEGQELAFKAYPQLYLDQDSNIEKRIRELAENGSPHHAFLWPIQWLKLTDGQRTFMGYTMPLRGSEYIPSTDFVNGTRPLEFRTVITAAKNLADAFFHLHTQGLCYKDISFGNFFFNPQNGDCIICDIDNICYSGEGGGVLGTPGFMAPEIVTGNARPCAGTDLHSLAVLIFYMFYIHHPLDGKQETAIRIMDDIARRKIYGTDALYIFHPTNKTNCPDPGTQSAPLIMDEILPKRLKDTFKKAFVNGLKNRDHRVVESEWRIVLDHIEKNLAHCNNCGQEVFIDKYYPASTYQCWNCKKEQYPITLSAGAEKIMLSPGVSIQDEYGRKIGTIVRHPADPKIIGLRNETDIIWLITKPDGEGQRVPRGKSVVVGPGVVIMVNDYKMVIDQFK